MSIIYKKIASKVVEDIKTQYTRPFKSITGSLLTRYWSKKSKPLVFAAINELNVKPDHKILEVGFGRGEGLERVTDIIAEGSGIAFGLETSEYMKKCCVDRFAIEFREISNIVQLDMPLAYLSMPYPSDLMDGIYHVDTYYSWTDEKMFANCREFERVLKPGERVVCALDLKWLKKLEDYDILAAAQYDPIRYMEFLDEVGFDDVHVEYRKIDEAGNFVHPTADAREIQLVLARKRAHRKGESVSDDPFDALEKEISEDLARMAANPAALRRQRAHGGGGGGDGGGREQREHANVQRENSHEHRRNEESEKKSAAS